MKVLSMLLGVDVEELKRWGWIAIGSVFLVTFVLGAIAERILLYRKGWRKKDED
jgi:hypothetical protein